MSSARDYITGASGGGICSSKASGNNKQSNSKALENTRNHQQLVYNPAYNHRGYLDLDKITAEDVARLCEISDEEFNDQCEDDNDENYVPSENDEKSVVQDILTGGRVPTETEVEVNSDDDEEVTTESDTTETPPLTDVYRSSDSTIWNKVPSPSSQTRSYTIIREPDFAFIIMSCKRFGGRGKEMIASLTSFFEPERDNDGPFVPLTAVRERVAAALNISIRTVDSVSQIVKNNNALKSPKKQKIHKKLVTDVETFQLDVILNTVYRMYDNNSDSERQKKVLQEKTMETTTTFSEKLKKRR
ncbi:hypothetical protein FQA39_LY08100 [Lamprigera yunnana]|nr:hypothetical protein FQA39_LY08100 [Lamprigera yunnana]